MPKINWYPGHMAKTRRLLQEQLRVVDAVIELCDARAPLATRNPDLERLTRDKARILILNKADLAGDSDTARWLETFRRQGQDLVLTREISFVKAALGHTITVPGLDGDLELKIAKGTQSGTVLRLPGKGLPYLNQKRNGDLLVEILVKTPTNLSARQEELLREFESSAEESIGDKIIKGVENLLGGKSKKKKK